MMSLFDDEQIMRTYAKNIEKETSVFFPEFTDEEAKEIEAEVMQLV